MCGSMVKIMKEYLDIGKIGDYGLTHLHTYFGYAFTGYDLMYSIRLVYPAG